jgi:enoyl-CoA hydratase
VINFEEQGRIGIATIDRPERRNALNGELCTELRHHLEQSADLRAIVITGAGTAFCAGADLVTRFAAHGDSATDTFRPAFEEVLDAIVAHPAPVIAAINGPAMGAGMQLAVACDLRVTVSGARFAIPGGKLGIHLSARNIWRLAQLVGQGAARDFLLAGRTVDGAEALRLGLVQYVEADARAGALALAGLRNPMARRRRPRRDRGARGRRVREQRPAGRPRRLRGEAHPRLPREMSVPRQYELREASAAGECKSHETGCLRARSGRPAERL